MNVRCEERKSTDSRFFSHFPWGVIGRLMRYFGTSEQPLRLQPKEKGMLKRRKSLTENDDAAYTALHFGFHFGFFFSSVR